MRWISGLIDRILAVIGALAFSQIPLFMLQYHQRLSGHVSELKLQVEIMRQAALQTGKTLDQYTQKFLESSDPDFMHQGDIIHAMISRWQNLSDSMIALHNATPLSRPFVFLSHINLDVVDDTFKSFQMGIPLTIEGLIYALIGLCFGFLTYYLISRLFLSIALFFRGSKNQIAPKNIKNNSPLA